MDDQLLGRKVQEVGDCLAICRRGGKNRYGSRPFLLTQESQMSAFSENYQVYGQCVRILPEDLNLGMRCPRNELRTRARVQNHHAQGEHNLPRKPKIWEDTAQVAAMSELGKSHHLRKKR